MKNKFALLAFLLLPFLAFADEQKPITTSNPFSFLGDIFSPKTAKLNKLIEDKKLKEADEYLTSEKKYFLDNKKDQIIPLNKLATELNAIYEPQLSAAEEKVSKVSDYSQGGCK